MKSVPVDRRNAEPSRPAATLPDQAPAAKGAESEAGGPAEGERPGKGGTLAKLAGWTMTARVVAQFTQFAGFVIAARFLGPADFGLFSLVYLFTMLLTLLAGSGWRELLLTHDREGDAAQFLALALGGAAGLLFGLGGTAFSKLSGTDVAALCWLLGLAIPLLCVTTVQGGRLLAEGRARQLAVVQILGEVAALGALVVSLTGGMGLLALGISKLALACVGLLTAVLSTRWLGSRVPRGVEVRGMVRFTGAIMMSRLISFGQENMSLLLVGVFLGPAGAGLYRGGARLAGALTEVLSETMRIVGWSAFRQAREAGHETSGTGRAEQMRAPAIRLLSVLLLVSVPAFVGLAVLAPLMIATLLGPEWSAAAGVLSLLALRRMLTLPQSVLEPVLSLTGAVRIVPRLNAINAAASLLLLLLLVPRGILAVAAGQAIAGVLSLAPTLWALRRYANVTVPALMRAIWPALASAGVMLAALALTRAGLERWSAPAPWMEILLCAPVGIAAYVCALCLMSPEARIAVRAALGRVTR